MSLNLNSEKAMARSQIRLLCFTTRRRSSILRKSFPDPIALFHQTEIEYSQKVIPRSRSDCFVWPPGGDLGFSESHSQIRLLCLTTRRRSSILRKSFPDSIALFHHQVKIDDSQKVVAHSQIRLFCFTTRWRSRILRKSFPDPIALFHHQAKIENSEKVVAHSKIRLLCLTISPRSSIRRKSFPDPIALFHHQAKIYFMGYFLREQYQRD